MGQAAPARVSGSPRGGRPDAALGPWQVGAIHDQERIGNAFTVLLRRAPKLRVDADTETYRLERSGYGILCELEQAGPKRPSDIARALGLEKSTLSRQVAALVSAGLVERVSDPNDGRARILALTTAGQAAVRRTRRRRSDFISRALDSWTPERIGAFAALLESFNEAISAELARESR
jgi:DNA-binding MarR family transcriptional regulator